jgi:hypothetical protein
VSVRFGSIKDLLYRSQDAGDTVPRQHPLTVCGWLYVYKDIKNAGPLFARYANAMGTERSGAYVSPSGTSVLVEATASTSSWSSAEALKLGAWQFWAYRRQGDLQELLLDGNVVRSARGAPAADTSAAFVFGCTSTEYVDGEFARWRIWETALSDADIVAEKHAAKAVKAGVWADYPMAPGNWGADVSGNDRRLRPAGALSNGSSEPLAISVHPTDQAAAIGTSATFAVVAVGSGVAWQWQDNRSGSFANVSDGKGGRSARYTTAAVDKTFQGRQYRVVASDASGSVASAVARLTVPALSAVHAGVDEHNDKYAWSIDTAPRTDLVALLLMAGGLAVARRLRLVGAARSAPATATKAACAAKTRRSLSDVIGRARLAFVFVSRPVARWRARFLKQRSRLS